MASFLALIGWKEVPKMKNTTLEEEQTICSPPNQEGGQNKGKAMVLLLLIYISSSGNDRNPTGTNFSLKYDCVGFSNKNVIRIGVDLALGTTEVGTHAHSQF